VAVICGGSEIHAIKLLEFQICGVLCCWMGNINESTVDLKWQVLQLIGAH